MRNRRRGLTLLEVLIASAILAAVVGLTMYVYWNGLTAADEARIRAEMTVRGRMLLDRIREELQFSRIRAIENDVLGPPAYHDHTGVRFQLPIGIIGGIPTYGYRDGTANPNVQTGRGAIIRFIADEAIREPLAPMPIVAPPAIPAGIRITTVDADLNVDGDRTDIFYAGNVWLQFVTMDDTGAVLGMTSQSPIGGRIVLHGQAVVPQDLDGDLNNDGADDPMFKLMDSDNGEIPNTGISSSTRKVQVTLWHGHLDTRRKRLIVRRNQEFVRLENPQ